jgi:ABC-type branched-subunit amino acid transport system substrate-binding protein
MEPELFNGILNELTEVRSIDVLRLFLQGKSYPEISSQCCITKEAVATNLFNLRKKFGVDDLVDLFCKCKIEWVSPRLYEERGYISVNEYITIEETDEFSSNRFFKSGIEFLKQQKYKNAINSFENAVNADPSNPLNRIYLNNARVYLHHHLQPIHELKIAVVIAYDRNSFHIDASKNVLRGIADAQTEFNANGGHHGRLLEVIVVNDNNDPLEALKVAAKIVENPNIIAVIGHHSSEGSEAALSIYQAASMVLISPTSTSSVLASDFFFRTIGSTELVAQKYVEYLRHPLNFDKIAIFYHRSNKYSQTLKDDFEAAFINSGNQVTALIDMSHSGFNIQKSLERISQRSSAALVIPSIATNSVALAIARENIKLQSRKLKLFLATSLPENSTLLKGGEAVEGAVLVSPRVAETSAYMKRAKVRWESEEINWRVHTSFDAAQALIDAIRQSSGTPTRQEIFNNLKSVDLFEEQTSGCGLRWSDDHSNIHREYCITQICNGQFERLY